MYRECMTAVWQRWKPGVARPKRPATSLYSPHIRSRVFELIRKDNIRRHLRYGGRTEGSSSSSTRIPIPNRVSIDDRPAHVNGQTVGGQGDGHDRRKERQGAVVTLVERERCFMLMEKLYSGKRSVPPAHVIVKTTQRERDACKDHNHRQGDGVCCTWNHRKGTGHHGLLCTSILLLRKGGHREDERTCQAVHP